MPYRALNKVTNHFEWAEYEIGQWLLAVKSGRLTMKYLDPKMATVVGAVMMKDEAEDTQRIPAVH